MQIYTMTAAYQDEDVDTDDASAHDDTDEKEVDNDIEVPHNDDEMMIHVTVHMTLDDDQRHCTAADYVHDE